MGADVNIDFKMAIGSAKQSVDVVDEGLGTVANKLVNDFPIARAYNSGTVGHLNGGYGGTAQWSILPPFRRNLRRTW